MHKYKNLLPLIFILLSYPLIAQNYQAINGSRFAGSLAPTNNPAAIVHVPYGWDITPFAVQLKHSTNAFQINNYSLLSKPNNVTISAVNGVEKRFVFANQDIRLLNTRIRLNDKAAIAFGANIRNYAYLSSSNSNWQDTAYSLADYLKINLDHRPLSADAAGSTWAELYGSYAQTIFDDGYKVLNAGITLKLNRSIAGLYGKMNNADYATSILNKPIYSLTTGSLQYGYSANIDNIDSNKTANANISALLQNNSYSLGADIGIEYIFRTERNIRLDDEQQDDFAYNTKIGISLMDIGSNKFSHGSKSSAAIAGLQGITDTLLESKFKPVRTINDFNDSLASISKSFTQLGGDFYIYKPTRLVINVDQHIADDFYVNAELTIPLLPAFAKNTLFIRDMNLLAITPRWETKTFGAYIPILFNTRQQLWVGAAFKAGPLLLGTHNLANLFGKNSTQSGGLYLAFTIRPGKKHDGLARDRKDKLSPKAKQNLRCPAF
jgi:hypothetical protein